MAGSKHYAPEGFTERMEDLFNKCGISRAEMARRTGIDGQTLYSYIYGGSAPNLTNLVILCRFFHVSADYLLTGKNSEAAEEVAQTLRDCEEIMEERYRTCQWKERVRKVQQIISQPTATPPR